MKLHTGLGFAGLLAIGLINYSCANGDTASGGNGGSTGNGGDTGSGGNTGSGGSKGGTTGTGGSTAKGGNTGSGGSKGGTTGTGGTIVSSGGTTGTGGTGTGTGGTSTTGTGGTTSVGTCLTGASTTPTGALITDFSDAMASSTSSGDFTFGMTAGMLGGTSRFAAPGTTGTLSVTGGMLTFTGMVPAPAAAMMYPYSGFVVYANGPACVNANSYTGVQFSLSGSGTCSAVFSFGDSDHTTASADANRGACTAANCYASQFTVTLSSASATVKMPFAGTPANPGLPTPAVDASKFTGVQWQLQPASSTATSACTGTITVGDISFY